MLVVADRQIPFLRGVLEPYADVVYLDGGSISPADVKHADALLVRTRTQCDSALLQASQVRFVGSATIGTDHFDIPWLESQKISWANAPGCNANAVTQYVVAALLTIAVRHGISLEGKVLGVVGVGAVGARVAVAAKILGMKVLLNDPPRVEREGRRCGCEGINSLLRQCDFITFHTPLTTEGKHPTWRMANGSFLSKLSPHTWLINSSRGSVVDNTALRIALRSNSISGAVLDVWEDEPNNIDQELLNLLEIGTPHIAGYSVEGKANGTSQIVQALARNLAIEDLQKWSVPSEVLNAIPGGVVQIDADKGSDELVLHEAVMHSYDIISDDATLRQDTTSFEDQRSHYSYRREFPAFTVELRNAQPSLVTKVKGLGFKVCLLS